MAGEHLDWLQEKLRNSNWVNYNTDAEIIVKGVRVLANGKYVADLASVDASAGGHLKASLYLKELFVEYSGFRDISYIKRDYDWKEINTGRITKLETVDYDNLTLTATDGRTGILTTWATLLANARPLVAPEPNVKTELKVVRKDAPWYGV